MTYYGFDLPPATNETHVRPSGLFVTAYSSAMVGPEGVTRHPRRLMLWEWDDANGGHVIASCSEGDAEPIRRPA